MLCEPYERCTRLDPDVCPYPCEITMTAEVPRYIAGLAVTVALTAQGQSILSRWHGMPPMLKN